MLTYNIHSIIRIHIIYNLQYCDGIIIIIVIALSPHVPTSECAMSPGPEQTT